MIKIFISCPMKGLSDAEIRASRDQVYKKFQQRLKDDNITVINSYFPDFETTAAIDKDIYCLGKAITKMAEANIAVFAEGWEKARGCRIEHDVAVSYGLRILYV